tara:strand:- start:16375 stop:16668 length:294 start_codon:yes stop_codon:yes gene_type:complete
LATIFLAKIIIINKGERMPYGKGPAKGKAKVKTTAAGKKVSYGQKGAKVKPGTKKGDAYCARSAGQMKKFPKSATNPNSPLRLSRKRWACEGTKSKK